MVWRNPRLSRAALVAIVWGAVLSAAPLLHAQVVTGTLLGTVTDPSGQVVPNVEVVATLVDRGLQRTTTTNDAGAYELGFLPVGTYRIIATASGFKAQVQENVELRLDQRLRIDFSLQLGALTEEVTVTGSAPLVSADSSNIGETVEQQRVLALPVRGRQFVDLVTLSPGTTPEVSGAFGGQFAIAGNSVNVNGNRSDSNNFLLDGVPINDSMWGRMAVSPSLDAIEEMKVQSFLYTAEFGSAGGGQVNITMRSGQNTVHGTGFGFFRRDRFDSKNFFATQKPPLERNNYGFSLGGPIIPSKTFFFANAERNNAVQGITLITSVPSEALRGGDFGATPVIDPLTQAPFPNNRIPDSRIDAVSKSVLALLPLPTRPGLSNNFSGVENSRGRSNQLNLRFDHQVSSTNSLSGHLNVSDILGQDPVAGSPPGFAPIITLKTKTLGAQWTHVLGPSAINQFRLGYTRSASVTLTANSDLDFASQTGIQGTSHDPRVLGVPRVTITGFGPIGDTVSTLSGETGDYHFIDDFSATLGAHSFKTGVTVSRLKPSPFFAVTPRGNFSYLGTYTGNAFGDFLLGLPATASVGVGDPLVNGRAWRTGAYVQDDWRVTPHLTMNVGLRYELLTPPTDTTNRLSNLDLATGNIILPCDAGQPSAKADLTRFPAFTFVCNDTVGLGKGLTQTDKNNWGPRVGFAYSTESNQLVVRGGYGIFYSYPPMAVRIGTPSFSIPFFSQITATNSATNPATTATDPRHARGRGVCRPAVLHRLPCRAHAAVERRHAAATRGITGGRGELPRLARRRSVLPGAAEPGGSRRRPGERPKTVSASRRQSHLVRSDRPIELPRHAAAVRAAGATRPQLRDPLHAVGREGHGVEPALQRRQPVGAAELARHRRRIQPRVVRCAPSLRRERAVSVAVPVEPPGPEPAGWWLGYQLGADAAEQHAVLANRSGRSQRQRRFRRPPGPDRRSERHRRANPGQVLQHRRVSIAGGRDLRQCRTEYDRWSELQVVRPGAAQERAARRGAPAAAAARGVQRAQRRELPDPES